MGESNTVVSAYTLYRHLRQYRCVVLSEHSAVNYTRLFHRHFINTFTYPWVSAIHCIGTYDSIAFTHRYSAVPWCPPYTCLIWNEVIILSKNNKPVSTTRESLNSRKLNRMSPQWFSFPRCKTALHVQNVEI